MLWIWKILLKSLFLDVIIFSSLSTAGFLNTIFGLPKTCVHQNAVHQCQFSFSCWLQGGKYASGCGPNRWLFSCCIPNDDDDIKKIVSEPNVSSPLPKRSILKRRDDGKSSKNFDCGIPKNSKNIIQKRIIGGRPARFAEYPWQAHIRIGEFQCGGVLVSKIYVATAAHCIQQARIKDIFVYLGELDTQNSGAVSEPFPSQKYRVLQKIIHPRFKFRMTQPDRYDIALLKLARPTGYSSHISPICLPQYFSDLIGRKGIIAGWGKTEANMGHVGTNILQTAAVPIISRADCIDWHDSKQINIELFNEMLCAGHSDGHQDACLGDSGGPLIIKERGRYTLIGITSAGFGCGVDHQPGIYHNVQITSKWIQDMIQTQND